MPQVSTTRPSPAPFVPAARPQTGSDWLTTVILLAIMLSIGFFGFS